MAPVVSERSIRRLSLYRRFLIEAQSGGRQHIFSHDIAAATQVSSAQVRRDLMAVSGNGSARMGYAVPVLIAAISHLLDAPEPQEVALVGVGNLGRAILAYFSGRRPNLRISVTFDIDPAKTDRLINGCPCCRIDALPDICASQGIHMAIITTPAAAAQGIADLLIRSGVRGIVNFAPVTLHVPAGIFVETMDFIRSLETVAFYAR